MDTASERHFRSFCRHNHWWVWRVRTHADEALRRPDFVAWRWWHRLAVEVKQVEPNSADRVQARRLDEGMLASFGGEPGGRLRHHLKDASSQLKALTRCRWPGLVVLFDHSSLSAYVDPYNIKAAMFGLEQVVMERADGRHPTSHITNVRFGPKRQMTKATGTAVSAVARLYAGPNGEPRLDVFHNDYASQRMSTRLWSGPTVRHFRLEQKLPGMGQDWELC